MNQKWKNGQIANAKVIHRFREFLKEVEGLSDKTIVKMEAAIQWLEDQLQGYDFRVFNKQIALTLKRNLLKLHPSKSIKTISFRIDTYKRFLSWLAILPGYKRSIRPSDIGYLNLSRNTIQSMRTNAKVEELPSSDDVKKQINSIDNTTDVGRRNRGIFAGLDLSGVRIDTLISLPINAFDPEKRLFYLEEGLGVRVKFGYQGITKLIAPDPEILAELIEYHDFLLSDKQFEQTDPLFPKTGSKTNRPFEPFNYSEIIPEFWMSESSCRKMMQKTVKAAKLNYFHPHLYRHSAILRAVNLASGAAELKAVSKNFSHKDVLTTLITYGNVSNREQLQILSDMETRHMNDEEDIMTHLLRVIAQNPVLVEQFKKMTNDQANSTSLNIDAEE